MPGVDHRPIRSNSREPRGSPSPGLFLVRMAIVELLTRADLNKWIVPHTPAVIDIQMLRVPSSDVFRIYRH